MNWLKEHLALFISGISVLTVVIKVWAVSHGDPVTIVNLLTSAAPLDLALAAVVLSLPLIGAVPVYSFSVALVENLHHGRPLRRSVIAVIVFAAFALTLAPVAIAVVILAIASVALVYSLAYRMIQNRFIRSGKPMPPVLSPPPSKPKAGSSWLQIIAPALFVTWAAVVLTDTPWYPAEQIEVKDPAVATVVGYVIDESPVELTFLRESDRQVVTVQAAEVTQRTRCRGGAFTGESLVARIVWSDRPDYPHC